MIFIYITISTNWKTKQSNPNYMNTLLFILLALIALSSYACGHLFSFKERYKKWYEKLFNEDGKPSNWGFSRQTNHDRCALSEQTQLCFVIMFVVVSFLSLEDLTISLGVYVITLVMAIVVPVILGLHYGKRVCDKVIRKECKTCKISIPELWKNPQGYLGDFFDCLWLVNFEIHGTINLLHGIEF